MGSDFSARASSAVIGLRSGCGHAFSTTEVSRNAELHSRAARTGLNIEYDGRQQEWFASKNAQQFRNGAKGHAAAVTKPKQNS